jgi:predicted amidophosphoribosyltransferase
MSVPAASVGSYSAPGVDGTERVDGTTGMTVAFPATMPLAGQRRFEHAYLDTADTCWVLADYRAGTYRCCYLNQLIANFKCRPSTAVAHAARMHYKQQAIGVIAAALRRRLDRRSVEAATWVPIPPSRIVGSPDYDDRLVRTLRIAFRDYDLDLRQLLRQTDSTPSDHERARRLSPASLLALLQVDTGLLRSAPLRERLILFDDLLTTGKHYKCCQLLLRDAVPQIPICGWFVARRVTSSRWRRPPADDLWWK